MNLEQIERIRQMEQWFDFALGAIKETSIKQNIYPKIQKAIEHLADYYGSDEWKQDYADDEAGLLPKDLKRGVLSEDGIWNLLHDWDEMQRRL